MASACPPGSCSRALVTSLLARPTVQALGTPTSNAPRLVEQPREATEAPPGIYEVWVTTYGYESCNDPECYTASGIIAGSPLPDGAQTAACGYFLELGRRFLYEGTLYACIDRGGGPHYWVDLWLGDHSEQGVTIEVLP